MFGIWPPVAREWGEIGCHSERSNSIRNSNSNRNSSNNILSCISIDVDWSGAPVVVVVLVVVVEGVRSGKMVQSRLCRSRGGLLSIRPPRRRRQRKKMAERATEEERMRNREGVKIYKKG